jgi:dephospho-CoA kinase
LIFFDKKYKILYLKDITMHFVITGNIGSGKSTLFKQLKNDAFFEKFSFFNLDEYINHSYQNEYFQKILYQNFKTTDKKIIGQLYFSSPKIQELLDHISEPYVLNFIQSIKKTSLSITEFPILFEYHYEKNFDKIILVRCDEKIRIQRIKNRSDWSDEKIQLVLQQQLPEDYKSQYSDYIVDSKKYSNMIDFIELFKKDIQSTIFPSITFKK